MDVIIIIGIATFMTLVALLFFDQSEIGWKDAWKAFFKRLAVITAIFLITAFIALSMAGVIF